MMERIIALIASAITIDEFCYKIAAMFIRRRIERLKKKSDSHQLSHFQITALPISPLKQDGRHCWFVV
jgi:hypothetical protein